MEHDQKNLLRGKLALLFGFVFFLSFGLVLISAEPDGVSDVNITSNETREAVPAFEVNISGGYISTMNVTASVQNPRWKAFVGWVVGRFTLDNFGGDTIYDWELASTSGNIFATRNETTVMWADITCANSTILENENIALNHTNSGDNITITFSDTTHDGFFVGGVEITQDTCPSLHTYVNSESQSTNFQQVALFDSPDLVGNVVYSTKIEEGEVGFDGNEYDFQMIVPEVGLAGWSGATPYYLYVELN